MEDFNAPIAVCDTLPTKEKYALATALMQRGTKAFPIIYIVCGALIVIAMLLEFLVFLFLLK